MHLSATVSLPNAPSPRVDAGRRYQSRFCGYRALVVEDVETTRQALVAQLADMGFATDAADDSFAGFAKLDRAAHTGRRFDLVVLDRTMAGLSGADLAARIRRTEGIAETKLIMTNSGEGFNPVGRCAAAAGMLDEHAYQRLLLDCLEELYMIPLTTERPSVTALPRPLRVLLVDDNAINQRLAMAILSRDAHVIQTADDGAQAVAAASRETFDLILMDIQMPVMDGVEATRKIRALAGPMKKVPIIALTAHAEPGARERYLAAGMNDYVAKPLAPVVLLAKVQEWAPVDTTQTERRDALWSISQSLAPPRGRAVAFVN